MDRAIDSAGQNLKKHLNFIIPVKDSVKMVFFCREEDIESNLQAAGTIHASTSKTNVVHVENITQKWKEMATKIGDNH